VWALADVCRVLGKKGSVFQETMKTIRWWTACGALIGAALVLSDLLFGWRGSVYAPWTGISIAANVFDSVIVIVVCALIGLTLGRAADAWNSRRL
jgi:hypothetical protein